VLGLAVVLVKTCISEYEPANAYAQEVGRADVIAVSPVSGT
jgi:hypothetical protein